MKHLLRLDLAKREAKCRALIRRHYRDVPSREESMDRVVLPLLGATDRLLDAGAGSTLALLNHYAPRVSLAAGIDLVVPTHQPVAKARVAVGDLTRLPFKDASFEVAVSRSVMEHLPDPAPVFREVGRVLKPGGRLIFTTPNKYYYSSIIAGLIPYGWKDRFMRGVFGDRGYDHFPVFYQINTRRAFRRVAAVAGLTVERVDALRHFPYYLLFSPLLFRLGILYDWIVTWCRLDSLQSTWLVVMRRPPDGS